jgi:hypothetical protein
MERRNAEDWDGIKLETLAREYMEVRKEMWEILGRRVNEKWQIVEAKVCAVPLLSSTVGQSPALDLPLSPWKSHR